MTTIQASAHLPLVEIKANEPIDTPEKLYSHLYMAAQLEMSTIPLYLYAGYSITTQNASQWAPGPGAFRLIKSIVIEEMLHLSLARNLIIAIGYGDYISFCDPLFLPTYPSPMLNRIPKLELKLAPLSRELVKKVFMELELPAKPDAAPESDEYHTIGQFYKAIYDGFTRLCGVDKAHPGGDPARIRELFKHNRLDLQYVTAYWNEGGGGEPQLVHDLRSALTAINTIVEQGEGMDPDQQKVPLDPEDPSDPQARKSGLFEDPHYVKFRRIAQGWEPIGEVYPVPENPRVDNYPAGPVRDLGLLCNAAYTYVLRVLDEVYNTSGKDVEAGKTSRRYGLERKFIAAMQGLLFGVVNQLVRVPIEKGKYKGHHAAPTFEWYDDFPQGTPMTDHLRKLCERVVPHFPALGGDNSVLWLIDKMQPLTMRRPYD